MVDWLKEFQSMGRGIRNGELTVAMSGTGKSLIVDMESQGIEPSFSPGFIRNFTHDHWCHDPETDQWTFHRGRPYHEYVVGSDRIIAKNPEGVFYWFKDRSGGHTPRNLDEAELKDLLFVILGAEEVVKTAEWIDVSKFRAKGAGIKRKIP